MAAFGTVDVVVKVDASCVLDVVAALDMLTRLVESYDHEWTDEEWSLIEQAVAACQRENLVAEAAP